MKLKKKHFKKLKEIAVAVNQIVPGTGVRLDKLIAEIESVQKLPVEDMIYAMHRKDVEANIIKEGKAMVAASTDNTPFTSGLRDAVEALSEPKIGDVGYFWDEVGQGIYYGIIGIVNQSTYPYCPVNYGGISFKHFSKTPPELR